MKLYETVDIFDINTREEEEEKSSRERGKLKRPFLDAWKVSKQRDKLTKAYHGSDIFKGFTSEDIEFDDGMWHLMTGLGKVTSEVKKERPNDWQEIDIEIAFTFENGVVEIKEWHEAS